MVSDSKKLRIKLIYAPILYSSLRHEIEPLPPLGLGILTAVLRENDYEVELDDLHIKMRNFYTDKKIIKQMAFPRILSNNLKMSLWHYIQNDYKDKKLDLLINRIIGHHDWDRSDVIGISVFDAAQFFYSLVIAKKIKQYGIPVIFGGAYMNTMGYKYFKKINLIDFLLVGGGELSLLQFINFLEGKRRIEDVPGLWYKHNGRTYRNHPELFKIEDSPMPDFNGLPLDLYKVPVDSKKTMILPYQISTGCISKCSFCNEHKTNEFQYKSYEKVIFEIKELSKRYNTHIIQFAENNIFFSYDYLERFCNTLIHEEQNIQWGAMTGIIDSQQRILDRPLLEKMKKAGCCFLIIGVETGSDRLRRRMGKQFTSSQVSEVLKSSYQLGINNSVNFIAGYPYETPEDLQQTVQFIKDNSQYMSLCRYGRFYISYNSPMHINPKPFRLKIIEEKTKFFKPLFEFDEIDRYAWKEKCKHIEKSYKIISRACYKYILMPNFNIRRYTPFWIFNLVMNIRAKNNWLTRCLDCFLSLFIKSYHKSYQHSYLLKYGFLKY